MFRVGRFFNVWNFCAPAVLVTLIVVGWPLLKTAHLSMTSATLDNLDEYHWVGLRNFINVIQDRDWWRAVSNTLVFTTISVFFETVFGLLIALLLNSKLPIQPLLRTSVLVPWVIPSVISAKMWSWMFNDLYGVINEILLRLGLVQERIAWLAHDKLAMSVVIVVDVWKTTPFMALLILASLQGIPKTLYEAARVDGSGRVKTFLFITLPLISPAIFVAVLFRTLDALRVFDLPYILTNNTPATATMSVYARQQLVDFQDVGYGSAASLLVFTVIGVFTICLSRIAQKITRSP